MKTGVPQGVFVLCGTLGEITMAGYRIVRINDDIKRELAQLIPNLKDPRVRGLISITRVDTTPDLR